MIINITTKQMNQSSCTLAIKEQPDRHQGHTQIQCTICLRFYQKADLFTFGCDHQFCRECLISYIGSQLTQYSPLKCCQEGCQQIIDYSRHSIYHQLTNYTKRKVDIFIDTYDRMRNVRICKKCSKGSLLQQINQTNKQVLKCRECHQNSCYNCFDLAHQGPCTNLESLDYPASCGQCRKCKNIIQKRQGCNHIKCLCGYEFCFQCSYHWDPSHICEFKQQRRTGWAWCACVFMKIFMAFPLAILLVVMYLVYIVTICLLSALILGGLGWVFVFQNELSKKRVSHSDEVDGKLEAKEDTQGCLSNVFKCFLFLLWLFFLVPSLAIFAIIGFFLPFWNLCYKQKIVFSPNILVQLWQSISQWIDVYLII